MAINQDTNPAHTSDWVCSNCGATLLGVNNAEIVKGDGKGNRPHCICDGILSPTRNGPPTSQAAGAERPNLGGGISYPNSRVTGP